MVCLDSGSTGSIRHGWEKTEIKVEDIYKKCGIVCLVDSTNFPDPNSVDKGSLEYFDTPKQLYNLRLNLPRHPRMVLSNNINDQKHIIKHLSKHIYYFINDRTSDEYKYLYQLLNDFVEIEALLRQKLVEIKKHEKCVHEAAYPGSEFIEIR